MLSRIYISLVLIALVGIVSVAAFLENPEWIVRMTCVAAPIAACIVLADSRRDKKTPSAVQPEGKPQHLLRKQSPS